MAILRNVAGGEIQEYTKMLAEARERSLASWKMPRRGVPTR